MTNLPGTTGAWIAGLLAAITVIGRQLQAAVGGAPVVDATGVVADPPAIPTDAPAQ